MADPTFFDLFETPWAETGTVDILTLPQYRAGWAFIGSLPPTVEQFNKLQQLNDQKLAWLFHQVKAVAVAAGKEIGPGTLDILIHALQNLDMDKATAGTLPVARGGTGFGSIGLNQFLVGGAEGKYLRKSADEAREILATPKICSIGALPATNIGPVVVAECGEVWIWSASASFTGYRSPLCGRPVDGHTVIPLPSEVDAVGGVLPKVAYARLWGYAQENGLVVTPSVWAANVGAHYFVDVDANTFRVPDLRNMFRRFTGTDADTANARAMGGMAVGCLPSPYGCRNHTNFALGRHLQRDQSPATGDSSVQRQG
ncbi:hypothetical protein [Achromobacter anxifer]